MHMGHVVLTASAAVSTAAMPGTSITGLQLQVILARLPVTDKCDGQDLN